MYEITDEDYEVLINELRNKFVGKKFNKDDIMDFFKKPCNMRLRNRNKRKTLTIGNDDIDFYIDKNSIIKNIF